VKFETFVALRYIWNSRRTKFLSLITLISVLGIALGVAALITVQSVMDGFQNQMKDKILGSNAHARLYKLVGRFEEYDDIVEKIRNIKGITAVTPTVNNEVMVFANQSQTGGLANGVDIKTAGKVVKLLNQLKAGKLECLENAELCKKEKKRGNNPAADLFEDFLGEEKKPQPPIIIGEEMARFLSVKVGDTVTVISPIGGGMGPTGPVPLSRNFRLVGIFHSGMYDYDFKFIYMSLKDSQKFFTMDKMASNVLIKVDDIYAIRKISNEIMTTIGGFPYAVHDWMAMNSNLFKALKLEKIVMFLILGFIILVASFNIVSTLIMLVLGKTREISILKAMGASNRSIMKIFMLDGFIIGTTGTILGMILAVIACTTLGGIEFPLAQEVYYMATLPVEMSPMIFLIVGIASMAISFLATIYPSWQAAKIKPAEGLRYD